MRILLMEDDAVLADIVGEYLQGYYRLDHAYGADEAAEKMDAKHYDLYILDINVPGRSGIELLRERRAFHDTTPAIIVTAYEDTAHLTAGFDSGAHDYIRKPFELEELRARIENSKRLFNIEQHRGIPLRSGGVYHADRKTIESGGSVQTLAPKEAALLEYFLARPGRTVSAEELMTNLWEFDRLPSDATLRSHIRRLREFVGSESIVTVRGVGYRYE